MECEEYRELFPEYLKEELDVHTADRMHQHIETCPECRKAFRESAELDTLFARLPVYEPSPESVLHIRAETIYKELKPEKRTDFGEVMDIEELAEFFRVTVDIIEEYISDIPCFELGGKLLFRKKRIEQWMEDRERDFGFQKLNAEVDRILSSQDAAHSWNDGK